MPYAVPKPNFKRRAPKKSKRGNFSQAVRAAIVERDRGLCQQCGGRGEEIHHVQFKSASGRGVYTNGVTLCHSCHRQVHEYRKIADYWRWVFTERYGEDYYKDEYDE